MQRFMIKLTFAVLFFFLSPALTAAHSGRTNPEGCHTNRKTGEYHCHGDKKSLQKNQGTSERYDRRNWKHWIDADGDCQDTRQEILIRDSIDEVKFKTSARCRVKSGAWIGPYTGRRTKFPENLDVDHIVPLGHAFEVGGKTWRRERKKVFANDFENLLAVDAGTNRAKGKKAPHQWMPPNSSFHCQYLTQWIKIKKKYGLGYLAGEIEHIEHLKAGCGTFKRVK